MSMISLCERLPYSICVDGKKHKLTPAFDNVLQLFAQMEDCALTDYDKLELMIYYLTDNAPASIEILNAACEALFPSIQSKSIGKKAFDFIQDSDLIFSAFYQSYGIDLVEQQGKLHWLKFMALLQGLPDNTRFREIISIRLRPMPKPTKSNAEERMELARLKQVFALKTSAAEREQNIQDGLIKMAESLMQRANKGIG